MKIALALDEHELVAVVAGLRLLHDVCGKSETSRAQINNVLDKVLADYRKVYHANRT